MIFYKKLVPFFSALVIGAMMELLIAYPLNWYIFLIVIALVVLVTVYYLNSYKFDKAFLGFAITPLLFAISGYLMIFFLETSYVEQIVIGVIFLGLLIYWGN
ncbi:presenilin, partial [Patescibacteria group bacterium]|nr:presenilin [Patescibacteria group bacterium]